MPFTLSISLSSGASPWLIRSPQPSTKISAQITVRHWHQPSQQTTIPRRTDRWVGDREHGEMLARDLLNPLRLPQLQGHKDNIAVSKGDHSACSSTKLNIPWRSRRTTPLLRACSAVIATLQLDQKGDCGQRSSALRTTSLMTKPPSSYSVMETLAVPLSISCPHNRITVLNTVRAT